MTTERIQLGAFIGFIALCFGVGAYAGMLVASLVSAKSAYAAETSRSFVHIETEVNGEKKVFTETREGDGSISVRVENGKVTVNGEEVSRGASPAASSTGASVSSVTSSASTARGADGRDGARGEDGKPGQDGASSPSVSVTAVSEAPGTTSAATTTAEAEARQRGKVYTFFNALASYVASLFIR